MGLVVDWTEGWAGGFAVGFAVGAALRCTGEAPVPRGSGLGREAVGLAGSLVVDLAGTSGGFAAACCCFTNVAAATATAGTAALTAAFAAAGDKATDGARTDWSWFTERRSGFTTI